MFLGGRPMSAWLLSVVLAAGTTLPVFTENDYIADPDRQLAPGAEAELEDLADTARIGGKGGLAVWVLADAKGETVEKLAQRAFNHGAVGHAENADAALLVLSVKQKKCAVVVGANLASAEAISVRDTLCGKLEVLFAAEGVTHAAREGARTLLHLVRRETEPAAGPVAVPFEAARAPEPLVRPPPMRHPVERPREEPVAEKRSPFAGAMVCLLVVLVPILILRRAFRTGPRLD